MLAERDARSPPEELRSPPNGVRESPGGTPAPLAQTASSDSSGSAAPIRRSPVTGAIESIGPYQILESLGEGGMGSVYLAEQTEPIRRRVAIKVIRLGFESKDLVARFSFSAMTPKYRSGV